jgi:hypothetical protein
MATNTFSLVNAQQAQATFDNPAFEYQDPELALSVNDSIRQNAPAPSRINIPDVPDVYETPEYQTYVQGPSQAPTDQYLEANKPEGTGHFVKQFLTSMIPIYGPAKIASENQREGYEQMLAQRQQQQINDRYEREAKVFAPYINARMEEKAKLDNMAHRVNVMRTVSPNISDDMIERFIEDYVGIPTQNWEDRRVKIRGTDITVPALRNSIGEIRYMNPQTGEPKMGTPDNDPMIEQVLPMTTAYEMRPQAKGAYNLQRVEVIDKTTPLGHRTVYADPRNAGILYDASTGEEWQPPDGVLQRYDVPAQPSFTPLVTDTGIYPYNTKTGRIVGSALADATGEKLQKTPAAARENMISMQEQLSDIQQLRALAERNQDKIGVFSGRLADLGRWLGTEPPEVNDMFRIADNLADKLLRARSGAQINEREFSRLRALIPDPRWSPAKFFSDLNSYERELNTIIQNQQREYGRSTGTINPSGSGNVVKWEKGPDGKIRKVQ